ncbi:MAG: dihydrofolate reductase family protein [Acidimicrobiia bacterium]
MLRRLQTGEPVDLLEMLFSEERRNSGRPWMMLNMVESVDGATAVGGGASGLNDADDRDLFLALRSVADVVMVGAQTVRSENLGPVRMNDEMMRHRQ